MTKENSWLSNLAKDVATSTADIVLLQGAARYDKIRDQQYLDLETRKESAASSLYQRSGLKSGKLVKAALIPRSGEGAKIIRFQFNPTDLQLSRSVSIEDIKGARTRRGLPKVNFGFVEPYQLTLTDLVFDTYETGENVLNKIQPILDAVDFSSFKDPFSKEGGYSERLLKASVTNTVIQSAVSSLSSNLLGVNANAMELAEYGGGDIETQALELRRPPVYYLMWGDKNYMRCMVESLDYKLTMFKPNGTPVRARVTIKLKEVDLGVADRSFSERRKIISK
ncbi:hypothetical protein [Limnospira sp. PMC 1042.18]|uniref:CIS tube protein n=1 Tax=Limnospira sp. PMC 1042.18 TaxID=2981018 RepID=UPI0028E0A9CC|nr:hypothetical protein [Limnospira sp. PMC 1042.18]MDT9200497.1 hypothetical protein [Limnospira sp. PMC 1042.18]